MKRCAQGEPTTRAGLLVIVASMTLTLHHTESFDSPSLHADMGGVIMRNRSTR